ncbi:MAG TPA: molybdopterin-dependent oxidoreductase [Gaiellaceae bacterium]|jgi:arsenite oxidase large subunit|nr:molybdopterin-dependent oxidoreductase [Gaiellaceae bacterium]
MNENQEQEFSRKKAVTGALVGVGALSLPRFLRPSDALAAGDAAALDQAMADFLGQPDLPVPPANAKVRTSACQFCNVGCGYKIYTWPVSANPKSPSTAGPYPKAPLDGWISPAMVTRAMVGGVDSYIAVVPDRDCIVNKGDHSPRGGANALTVYTTKANPLTNPTERLLHPMIRDAKGGALRQATWDEAIDLVASKIKGALDNRGPSSIGVWAADHLSPEMNFSSTKLFFAPMPRGLYNPALGPDKGVAVRAIHNRPKWNSEHPSLADNFGSANSLLYSYHDFELADTVLYTGTNSYETGTVFYNRVFAKKSKKVVIDPRRTQTAQNAIDFGGVHLQLKPNTDVVLVNSLMNAILAAGLQDQAYIDARVEPATYAQLKSVVTQAKYTPENSEVVTGVPAAKVHQAAKLLGKPNKTSLLFEKGVIWSGTQNAAVLNSYANLALLLGSVGRAGQVFGRQGGHQSAYMYDFDWPHPQAGLLRRNLWQELQKGTIDMLLVGIANPIRMQQQSTQLREFIQKVPFVAEINIRPSDMTEVADVVLPSTAWGEYTYSRENLERRVRVNQQFYDPAGEARPEYLIFAQIGKRIADKYGILDPKEWGYASWEDVFNGMRKTAEGRAIGIDTVTPAEMVALGTNGIQEPFTRQGNTLTGTERMYETKFPTPSGRASFVAHDYTWTAADPLAFLPEEIKPNSQYPLFFTTVRYQTVWQSGYTYRWLKQLPQRSVPYMEFMVNPKDAQAAGLKAGDWAELANQYSATQGTVNVTDEVPPGVVSGIFGWQGPTDPTPTGVPAYYANNLIGGGDLQQASNGAFYKNSRAALRKLDKPPRTAQNTPGLSEKPRYGHAIARGVDGDPTSKAKNFVSRTIP